MSSKSRRITNRLPPKPIRPPRPHHYDLVLLSITIAQRRSYGGADWSLRAAGSGLPLSGSRRVGELFEEPAHDPAQVRPAQLVPDRLGLVPPLPERGGRVGQSDIGEPAGPERAGGSGDGRTPAGP